MCIPERYPSTEVSGGKIAIRDSMSQQTLQTDTIDEDITCARCGYNLRGLSIAGCCPECALGVVESIDIARRRRVRFGMPLTEQSAAWQRLTGYGFIAFLAAALCSAGLVFVTPIWRGNEVLRIMAVLLTYAAMWCGVWLFTRAPAGEMLRSRLLRRSCRVAMSAACLYLFAYASVYLVRGTKPPASLSWDAMVFWSLNAITTIIAFAYLSDLAVRLDQTILRWSCTCMSVLAVSFLLGTAGAAGWINNRFLYNLIMIPDQPIVGPGYSFPSRLITLQLFRYGFWRELLQDLWMPCSLVVLAWFAILFIGLSRREDLPRNSQANSAP
jgi:hypothetical protein